MQGDNLADLRRTLPEIVEECGAMPIITDVNSDQQNRGLQASMTTIATTAARFGIAPSLIDCDPLRRIRSAASVDYVHAAQPVHVVMEASPEFWQNPLSLVRLTCVRRTGRAVPLSAFAKWAPTTAPLAVNHQGLFPATTISFNLAPGVALGDAVMRSMRRPRTSVCRARSTRVRRHGAGLSGIARQPAGPDCGCARDGVHRSWHALRELHPSDHDSFDFPSAGAGALLALLLTHTELTVIALIGIILLIGIVKKNAIMMVDFALAAERQEGKNPRDAIFEACLLRFRPILMTTMAAMLGALPLALGTGTGSELRRPLGIAIIGGLIVSQMLTLFTTPVVYLYFDRLQRWRERRHANFVQPTPRPGEA